MLQRPEVLTSGTIIANVLVNALRRATLLQPCQTFQESVSMAISPWESSPERLGPSQGSSNPLPGPWHTSLRSLT